MEFKFRAWDKDNQKMLYQDKGEIYFSVSDGKFIVVDRKTQFHIDNEYVMMFTGILDEKGNEIYDGDLVHSNQWNPNTMLIRYDRGAFYLAYKSTFHEIADIKYAERMCIIGNVYQEIAK